MNTKIIYTKKLANHLIRLGYNCINTEVNIKNPKFFVFIFENTNGLEDEINNYIRQIKEG